MKYLLSWGDLNPAQREAAVKHRLAQLIEGISNGEFTFAGTVGESIDAAREECERLRTPWFFAHAVYEKVGDLLTQLATSEAQEMSYRNPACGLFISDCVLPPC